MATSRKVIRFFCSVVIVAICALVLTIGMVSAADIIFVGPGENYTMIQSAVAVANFSDTIIVRDGTYNENVDVDVDNLTIRSENGSANCFVTALDKNDHVFSVTADWVNISGFTVQNATGSVKAGIYLTTNHCTISENTASNNYDGIRLAYSSNNNSLTNNTASNNTYGIELYSSCNNNTLTGNTALNNSGDGISLYYKCNNNTLTANTASNNTYSGISLSSSSNNTLTANIANSNSYRHGFYLVSSSNNTLSSNTANSNNDLGIYLASSSNNNTLTGNTALNNNNGIRLDDSSSNTLTGNTALNNYYGILLYSSSNNNTLMDNTASNNTHGIYLSSSSNNTLTGNTANSNNGTGIYLDSSSNNMLTGNNASSNNYDGIDLYSSRNNSLTANTANSNNDCGIRLRSSCNNNTLTGNTVANNTNGIILDSSSSNILTSNIASNNGRGIYLYSSRNNNLTGNTASNNINGIYLYSSRNNNLTGNTVLKNTNYGIYMDSSSNNNNLTSNTASNNTNGIYLYSSRNNNLTGNTISNNYRGIYMDSSSNNNNLMSNTASNNNYGIYLYSSSNNTLTGNNASNNSNRGIHLQYSSNNTLTGNVANSNTFSGIYLDSSSNNNHIYNNYFDNAVNAYDDGNNIWNISKTHGANIIGGSWLGGNYWSDYTGEDANGDGLGDSSVPYNASGNIVNGGDWLPLVPGKDTILVAVGASDYTNTLEHDALVSTLTALGYTTIDVTNVTAAEAAGADVIFEYDGGARSSSGDLNTWISSGKGYIQLGDWSHWFSMSYTIIGEGTTITVNITDPSHPVAQGLPASWQGRGFFAYGWWSDVFGGSVGYHEIGTLQADGHPRYNEGISATTYGSGRAVFFGFNVYGSEAGPNELLLLNNTIKWLCNETFLLPFFDTGEGTYPSISGIHNGTIRPYRDIAVSNLYTYPCAGTGGHTEYVKIWNSTTGWNVTATWNGYTGDWHNLTFNKSFTLYANQTYNYTIRTGSYPQIIHEPSWNATGGKITCTEFIDINGKRYEDWIPAIRLE
jgi:parallel beta-helix repeat protein